jgi:hypothetical protein
MAETRVTLRVLGERKVFSFSGHAVKIDRDGLVFYYVPSERNLGDFVHYECEVTLKGGSHPSVVCVQGEIISDFATQVSMLGLIAHRCTVRLSDSLSLLENKPLNPYSQPALVTC